MQKWTFKVFIKPNGDDTFEDWISGLCDAGVEERIRSLIKRLSNSDIRLWVRPYFAPLHGCKHINEIIVNTKVKQYRPLGCFGPGPQIFTLLVGTTKESKKRKTIWNPSSAVETAEKRRKLVYQDRRRYSREYQPRESGNQTTPQEEGT